MENVHSFRVPSGVLSLAMSNDDKRIAIGTLSSGLMVLARGDGQEDFERALRSRQYEDDPMAKYDDELREHMERRQKMRYMTEAQAMGKQEFMAYGSWKWSERGQRRKVSDVVTAENLQPKRIGVQAENVGWNLTVVRTKKFQKLKEYDNALRTFQHKKALDICLDSKDVVTVHSVLEELWRRDRLDVAFGGRNSDELRPLLEYLIYALSHPHLAQTALHCTAIVTDVYGGIIGLSDEIDFLFGKVAEIVDHQVALHKILLRVQGTVDMIMAAQDISANPASRKMLGLAERIKENMRKTKKLYQPDGGGVSGEGDESAAESTSESMEVDTE